jgi:hypothetical protein
LRTTVRSLGTLSEEDVNSAATEGSQPDGGASPDTQQASPAGQQTPRRSTATIPSTPVKAPGETAAPQAKAREHAAAPEQTKPPSGEEHLQPAGEPVSVRQVVTRRLRTDLSHALSNRTLGQDDEQPEEHMMASQQSGTPEPDASQSGEAQPRSLRDAEFFIVEHGESAGPYSFAEVMRRLEQGDLRMTDFTWAEGLPQWMPLSELLQRDDVWGDS